MVGWSDWRRGRRTTIVWSLTAGLVAIAVALGARMFFLLAETDGDWGATLLHGSPLSSSDEGSSRTVAISGDVPIVTDLAEVGDTDFLKPADSIPDAELLDLPLACEPGIDCWLMALPDHDPGSGAQDYQCGARTRDGHTGTDFAIRDLPAMTAGVPVLAMAAGKVLRVRDGMDDHLTAAPGAFSTDEEKCGNSILIDHGTIDDRAVSVQYCHLKKNSLWVRIGDLVRRRQPIAQVGISGATRHPAVQVRVRVDGDVVDPFVGFGRRTFCHQGEVPLWQQAVIQRLSSAPAAIVSYGVAGQRPDMNAIRAGHHRNRLLSSRAGRLVGWSHILTPAKGDQVHLTLSGPDGNPLAKHQRVITENHTSLLVLAEERRPWEQWPAGPYRLEILLLLTAERGGHVLVAEQTVVVE